MIFAEVSSSFDRIRESSFVKNVAVVAGGTAGAQALTMVFAPFITRLYGPEAYGLLGVFMALITILVPVGALTYPIAIVLPKEGDDAHRLGQLSVIIALVISVIIGIVMIVVDDLILALVGGGEAIRDYLFLVPVAVFFGAVQQVYEKWVIRKKQFKLTARANILQTLLMNSVTLGMGFYKPIAGILIVMATLKSMVYSTLLGFGIRGAEDAEHDSMFSIDFPRLKILARQYYDFPLYRAPQVFINSISQSLPVLMLASFFGPSAAGFYSLGKAVLGLPTQLIGQSIADVFYPRIVDAKSNSQNLSQLLLRATKAMGVIGLIPFGVVIIGGPWLFGFVFGDVWITAGKYAQWLSLMSYFYFVSRPCVVAIPVIQMQGILLVFEIFSIALRALGFIVGYYCFSDDLFAVVGFSVAGAVIYVLLMMMVYFKSLKFHCKP
ncbi:oligosaccharide flippase family protein [Candidatus Roizmanbacteria bacterium]|nr:oligosaccharide flippase family protein [Candidatus Roizmanbacteria bacterium]